MQSLQLVLRDVSLLRDRSSFRGVQIVVPSCAPGRAEEKLGSENLRAKCGVPSSHSNAFLEAMELAKSFEASPVSIAEGVQLNR